MFVVGLDGLDYFKILAFAVASARRTWSKYSSPDLGNAVGWLASEQLQLSSDIDTDLSNASLSIRVAENSELSDLIYRGERDPETLSDQELDRFTNIALPRLAMWENTYDSYLLGNLSEADWKAWDKFYRARWNWPGYKYIYLKYQIGFGKRSLEYFAEVFQIHGSELPGEP